MIRQSLQLAALFQAAVALAFGIGFPLARLVAGATPLTPGPYAWSLLLLVALGTALICLALLVPRRSCRGATLLLATLSLLLPLANLELCLRAFVPEDTPKTRLFVSDPELGWRLRPGAQASWGGYPVRINERGLRGPALPCTRQRESLRILYLGDSVTFGYKLQRHEDAYPYQAEGLLERALAGEVETLNAGVGGYSPWQQRAWLRREGLRYAPDLVLVGFVLNDVTEKLGLERFGGHGRGSQLAASYASTREWVLQHSALFRGSRDLYARLRFGPDPAAGALAQEALDIRHLLRDTPGERVEAAWQITLENLDRIFELCREHDIPVALLVFPDLLQLRNMASRDQPQRILRARTEQRSVLVLDLLRPMARAARHQPREWRRLFIDHDHLSASRSELVARLLRDFLLAHCAELLPGRCAS